MSVVGISNMHASLFHGPDDTVSRLEFLFHEPLQFIERVAAVDFRRLDPLLLSIRLRHGQAGEFADLAHRIAREQTIQKLLVLLAVVEVHAVLPAEGQHKLAHARMDAVLLVVIVEVTDQPPALVVEPDAVLLRHRFGVFFAPVLGMKQKPLFVCLEYPIMYNHVHWPPPAKCVRRVDGRSLSYCDLWLFYA